MSQITPVVSPASNRQDYDLDDDLDVLRWPQLRGLLLVFRETLLPVYLAADQAAMRQQRRHSWLVGWAAAFGTVAVLCAIVELSDNLPLNRQWIGTVELVAAAAAIIAVGLGIWSALQPDWLLKRFIAEQCRFVKFHLLLDPKAWHGRADAEVKLAVENLLQPLRAPERHFVHEWVSWKRKLVGRFDAVPIDLPDDIATELIAYYEIKRLRYQQGYFAGQAKKRHRWEMLTRNVSPCCFFLSIVAAFSHFVFEWFAGEDHHGRMHFLAGICVLLAAALPVVAAGVRTVRAAHEFGRNQLRFAATSNHLNIILGDIAKQPSSTAKIQLFREAESTLDHEHRAWLRLMIEAEWFG